MFEDLSSLADRAPTATELASPGLSNGARISVLKAVLESLQRTLHDQAMPVDERLQRAADVLLKVQDSTAYTGNPAKGGLAPWQMRKLISYIDAGLDSSIRNEELAALVRLATSHFTRAFRSSFGVSPHEYVTRRRIERAQVLMLSTPAPLSRIALDCGLADQAHFSRLFRRQVGESPRDWRRLRVDPFVENRS